MRIPAEQAAKRNRTATTGLDQTCYRKLPPRGTPGNSQHLHPPRVTCRPTGPDPRRTRTHLARPARIPAKRARTATAHLDQTHHHLPPQGTNQATTQPQLLKPTTGGRPVRNNPGGARRDRRGVLSRTNRMDREGRGRMEGARGEEMERRSRRG